MKAEEYLKENYSSDNNWKCYPPSENRVAEMMEQYANQRVIEELEESKNIIKEDLLKAKKEYDDSSEDDFKLGRMTGIAQSLHTLECCINKLKQK